MSLKKFDIDPANVDPDGLADGVATSVVQILLTGNLCNSPDLDGLANGNDSSVATIIIDGNLAVGGKYRDLTGTFPHIRILDAGGHTQTGSTYTLTGRGATGLPLSESIVGPASSAFVITSNRFSRVDTITIASPTASSTVDIGPNGTFTSADGLAHRLDIIGSAHVQTGATYTITGTNSNGEAQVETIAGPGSGTTIETLKYFLTVTSLKIASPVASSSIDLGTVDEIVAPVYLLNWRANDGATIAIMGMSGTIDVYIEETFDNLAAVSGGGVGISAANWISSAVNNATADETGLLTQHATAVRIRSASYTNTAEFQLHINQVDHIS